MNAPVNNRVARLMRTRKRTASYTRALVFTACLIAMCTALVLRMRGIALVRTEKVLDCHYAGEAAHTHDASCYDAQGYLVCPLVERELHTHTDACYKETRELTCGLEESAGHTHTDACYDEEGNLTCGIAESAGHTHTDSCYKVTRTLVCGKKEITENHVHGPGCFRTVTVDDGEPDATNSPVVQGESFPGNDPSPIVSYGELGEVAMPAQKLEGVLKAKDENDNEYVALVVGVKAPEGALPEGTTLKVAWTSEKDIDDQDLVAKTEAAVKKANKKATASQLLTAIDVTFEDALGNEIQPAKRVALKVSYDGIRTAEHPALVRTLDEAARAKFNKTDDVELVRSAKLVNQMDDDKSTGSENTLKIKTKLATTFVVVDVVEEDVAVAETIQEAQAQAQAETTPTADEVSESPTVVIGDGSASEDDQGNIESEPVNTVTATVDGEKHQLIVADDSPADENPTDESPVEEPKTSQFEGVLTNAAGEPVLIVRASAPEGALPEGTTMRVERVNNLTVKDAVEEAVAEEREGAVTNIQAVDITFVDAEGNEIEPTKPITVTMTSTLIEQYEQPLVVHVDNAGNAEVVQSLSERQLKKRDLQPADNELMFDADQFSTYCIVITTLERELVASDGNTYEVTVDCPAEAGIPQDAELEVTELLEGDKGYDSYLDQAAKAVSGNGTAAELRFARLFDISILVNGEKVQPKAPVAVKIELADAATETMSVVHFGDVTEVLDATGEGNVVSFEATGFSVYVVVDDGEVHPESRMTINFYGKDQTTPLAYMYVKNSDTAEDLAQIIYDPGVGEIESNELFKGWIINNPDYTTADAENALSIEDIREWALQQNIVEGSTVDVYAMIYKTYSVSFKDESNATVHTEALIFKSSEGGTTYTIDQPYTPKSQDAEFQGWYWTSPTPNAVTAANGSTAPFANGTEVTITGNVVFSPNVPNGYWLSFNENGKGASYTPPQFIPAEGDEVTVRPADPTRFGYRFDGWYTDAACTPGNEFTFGEKLTGRTDIYAKWTPVQTATYNVIIWQEKSSDTYANNVATGSRNYDFVEAIPFTGNVGSIINTVARSTSNNQRVTDGDGTQYYNATVNGTAKSYTGYHCATFDTNVEIVPEGTSVVNVYYDRNIVHYDFYYPYDNSYEYTPTTSNDGTQYGLVNGEYIQLTRHNSGSYYNPRYYWTYNDGWFNEGPQYTGTRYTRSRVGWQVYQKETGLYGEKLNWPTDNSIWWYPTESNGVASGTRMTYKNDFIPLDSNMNVKYYGTKGTGNNTIRFYTQDLDNPDSYTKEYEVGSNSTSFNVNDKFTGFHAYQTRSYTEGYNGGWSNWTNVGTLNPSSGIYGSSVSINNILEIRYNRIKNTVAFMDGSYFNGNGVRMDEQNRGKLYETDEYYYEADLTSYNEGGSNYYTPTAPDGYAFAGWYADETCTQPYNFTTMPVTGVTAYAKWVQKQYRVFLHPNVPETDTSLEWGQTTQQMNFRVDYNTKINGGSTIMGERSDYELIGWYTDPACTKPYNFDAFVLNDTTVTSAYDKTVDMTDEMNKYGNIVNPSTASNSDVNRAWITKKLDLYAKWRSKLDGAPGISVVYDAVDGEGSFAGGETTYEDPVKYYLDRAEAMAAAASTPNDNENKQFMHWVVQRWDETAQKYVDTTDIVYPGDTFEVLKNYARVKAIPEDEQTTPGVTNTYTVHLRAEYGDKDAPTPTHIYWYANNGTGYVVKTNTAVVGNTTEENVEHLQINQAVLIKPSDTFSRTGHKFLGWARVETPDDPTQAGADHPELTRDDLFLTYHEENGGYYTAVVNGEEKIVTKVAADEVTPYHDLYAVWEISYKVTVKKVVESSIAADKTTSFSFTPSTTLDSAQEIFILQDQGTKVYENIAPGTVVSVTEAASSDFEVTITQTPTTDANGTHLPESQQVTTSVSTDGVTVNSDVTITVTNTRKAIPIRINKVGYQNTSDNPTTYPLAGATFTLYTATVSGNTWTKGAAVADCTDVTTTDTGLVFNGNLPVGTYMLEETGTPDGYYGLSGALRLTIDGNGLSVSAPENYTGNTEAIFDNPFKDGDTWVLTVKNAAGVELPSAGGAGLVPVYVIGFMMVVAGALTLLRRYTSA